jgi:flavin-dependent dehydrogenase
MLWASRELIAATARALLQQQTRVRLIEETRVIGLRYQGSPARRRVDGVLLSRDDNDDSELAAELVVDASGRHSHADDWLRDVGVLAPLRDKVDAHAGFASRIYRARPDDARAGFQGLLLEWQAPGLPRGGALLPIEGDRWVVTLAGIDDQIPPTDEAGFRAFMRTLGSPALADAVAHAEPLSEIAGSRSTANVHRRYDRWRARLPGFIAVADAACAFNPIYGLGLSVAAACGSLLRAHLHQIGPQHPRFAERYFVRQAECTRDAWRLASAADQLWPHSEGARSFASPALEAYFRLVLDAGHFDPALRLRLGPVFGLTAPLSRLFEPSFVSAVMLSASRRRLQQRLFGASYVPDAPPLRIAR